MNSWLMYVCFISTGFLTTGFAAPTTETQFGVITNPILVPTHLDGVLCTGDERGIIDCDHNGVGIEDCSHREDTGIRCSEYGLKINFICNSHDSYR